MAFWSLFYPLLMPLTRPQMRLPCPGTMLPPGLRALVLISLALGAIRPAPSPAQTFDPNADTQGVPASNSPSEGTLNPQDPSGHQDGAPSDPSDPFTLKDQGQHNIRPQDVVQWQGFDAMEDPTYKVTVLFRLNLKSTWKVYTSNLKFSGPPGFSIDRVTPPPSKKFMDPISNKEVDIYEGGEFSVVLSGAPRWNRPQFPLSVTYVGCTDVICLFPYTETLELPFKPYLEEPNSSATPSEVKTSKLPTSEADAPKLTQISPTQEKPKSDWETSMARIFGDSDQKTPYFFLLGIVFLGGLLSNLTPCVYPMIPITLRVLSRQAHSPHLGAAAYAFGIIVTYTSLGLLAALSGGLFGGLLASKLFNIIFAVLMALLGLTMIGFGDLSKIQMLGQKFGSGTPSFYNAFGMGIGAGFVAAPCTGPILAALLAYTAKQESSLFESTGLLFTYSVGFGLPYMLLGGAVAQVSKIRVNPMVQVGVKIVFAAVMFGLSLYYLRIPFYGVIETMRGSWQPIAVSSILVGILILGVWLSSKTLTANKYASIIPAAILGLGFFATSQWLTGVSAGSQKIEWFHNEQEAFEEAQKQGKKVLLDMWAEWCEACKKMDATTFQDPLVMAEIENNWIPLKMDLTELDEASEKIQTHYSIQSLPTLVLSIAAKDPAKYKNIGGYIHAAELLDHLKDYRDRHP
jgi:thiol:disulfide interchange protein DsbD